MDTNAEIIARVGEKDPQWATALTAFLTASGDIAAVSAAFSPAISAGEARRIVASAIRFYAYIASFEMS